MSGEIEVRYLFIARTTGVLHLFDEFFAKCRRFSCATGDSNHGMLRLAKVASDNVSELLNALC
jgi:hypothetical protein